MHRGEEGVGQECEAAGHIESTLRRGAWLVSFLSFLFKLELEPGLQNHATSN